MKFLMALVRFSEEVAMFVGILWEDVGLHGFVVRIGVKCMDSHK